MEMQRIAVLSSNLASVGYDEITATLEVEFTSGAIYQYFDVPAHVHASLMSAPSAGSFFAHNVRNSYRYSQL
jgi:hypothetical protein